MKKLLALAAIAFVGIAADRASAVIVVNDNFDGYANQAAFETAWPAIGTTAPISNVLSTTQSVSPTNSIQLPGTATNSQYRNQQIFGDTTALAIGAQLVWSFDFWDAGTTAAPSPQRNSNNLQDTTAPGSTNQLVSMGLNNNQTGTGSGGQFYMARILGYLPPTVDPNGGANETQTANGGVNNSGMYFKLNDTGAGLRSAAAGWVNLKVILSTDDGVATDYAFYVNNSLAETVSNVGGAGTLRQYDNIRIGSGVSNGSTQAFVDNMYLEYIPAAVPEASSMLAVGLIGIVVGGANWARNRRKAA